MRLKMHNYTIIRPLGSNPNGGRVTYLAEKDDRRFALKQFQFAKGSSWGGFKEIDREVKILEALSHPQIPAYVESFETETGFCLVQEYIDAPSLAEVKARSLGEIIAIAHEVLEILVYLQSLHPPVLHRDIKPDNVLWDGLNVYLVDFGLSRLGGQELAASSIVVGTMGFIPPELFAGREPSKASDLYSLGATLLSLCNGTPSHRMGDLLGEDFGFSDRAFESIGDRAFAAWLKKMVAVRIGDRFVHASAALVGLVGTPDIELREGPTSSVLTEWAEKTEKLGYGSSVRDNPHNPNDPSDRINITSWGGSSLKAFSNKKSKTILGHFAKLGEIPGFVLDDDFYYAPIDDLFQRKRPVAARYDFHDRFYFDRSEVSIEVQKAAEALLVNELTKGWLRPWHLYAGFAGVMAGVAFAGLHLFTVYPLTSAPQPSTVTGDFIPQKVSPGLPIKTIAPKPAQTEKELISELVKQTEDLKVVPIVLTIGFINAIVIVLKSGRQ
jgi:serine/threonine protein kinase